VLAKFFPKYPQQTKPLWINRYCVVNFLIWIEKKLSSKGKMACHQNHFVVATNNVLTKNFSAENSPGTLLRAAFDGTDVSYTYNCRGDFFNSFYFGSTMFFPTVNVPTENFAAKNSPGTLSRAVSFGKLMFLILRILQFFHQK
jgi:hypothetical protein